MRNSPLVLGAAIWLAAGFMVVGSAYTVCGRTLRPTTTIRIAAPEGHSLSRGDMVFLATDAGLRQVGEVAAAAGEGVDLAIDPQVASELGDAVATCWQTPLSAEETVSALLPPDIQGRVAGHISLMWQDRGDEIVDAWKPVATGLATEYIGLVGDDLEAAVRSRSDEVRRIGEKHLMRAGEDWPLIQQRLLPILREHLTPVLSRLAGDAISDAPKAGVAWDVARGAASGDYDAVYSRLLDWLSEYVADMPEEDRRELGQAVRATLEAIGRDKPLMECLQGMLRRLRDDAELAGLAADAWREAVVENPRTAAFLRDRIVNDPAVRQEVYRTIELLGPTMRSVLAEALFDRNGATRPEVVHFVRSVALGRRLAWVTLRAEDGR